MNSHLLQQKTEPGIKQQIEQSPDLPVLPQGISHLIKTLMDDNISYEQLANELEILFKLDISINAYYTTFLDIIDDYVRANGQGRYENRRSTKPQTS